MVQILQQSVTSALLINDLIKKILSNTRKCFKKLTYIKGFLLHSRRSIMSKIS